MSRILPPTRRRNAMMIPPVGLRMTSLSCSATAASPRTPRKLRSLSQSLGSQGVIGGEASDVRLLRRHVPFRRLRTVAALMETAKMGFQSTSMHSHTMMGPRSFASLARRKSSGLILHSPKRKSGGSSTAARTTLTTTQSFVAIATTSGLPTAVTVTRVTSE